MHVLLRLLVLPGWFFAGIVLAESAGLKETIQAHFPESKIESVAQTPYLGLYEVVIDGEVFYTDEKADYFFMGHVVDAERRVSLTSERMQQIRDARRIVIDTLPLEHAMKTVRGNGKRMLIVYSDPNCPYCKRLEKELINVTDVTIHTLLYPILNGSMTTAEAIWCSEDRVKAWDDFMLRSVAPAGKGCQTPMQKLLESGRENKVTGTPTLIFADGSVVPGFIPQQEIEKRLARAVSK